jgi:predicted glycoside hydrolase/deacetylase ChbG (UPF0249 family)
VTRILFNADDFGLSRGIGQSILDLNCARALSSATLMATAEFAAQAALAARDRRDLGVGCHVVLVDGTPALDPAKIPALAPGGAFRASLGSFVRNVLRGAIPESEIEAEATAQIRLLQSLGVHLTHLDTHKHTHMFPGVLRPLLRAATSCGIKAIRNPFEPEWALRATLGAPALRRVQVRLLRTLRGSFLRLVRDAGLATTDGAIGVLATGTLDTATLKSLLTAMPQGTWEMVCHPGYMDEDLIRARTRLRESRPVEHAALLETVPRFLSEHAEARLIHFGQL